MRYRLRLARTSGGQVSKVHVFLDNSNLWIEGQRFASDPSGKRDYKDAAYRIDFGKILEHVTGDREIVEARMYGSEPPPNDTVWRQAEGKGFKVQVFQRNYRDKEKKVDTQMCVDITAAVFSTFPKDRVLVLLAGDADYIPAVEIALRREWLVEVHFWANANREIREHPRIKFVDLSARVMDLGYREIR